MDKLVDYLFHEITGVTIIVSTLLPNNATDTNEHIRNSINPQYADVVKRRQEKNQPIVLADLYSALTVEDLVDGTHPTDKGYRKLAEAWLSAISEAGKKGMLLEARDIGNPGINVPPNGANDSPPGKPS